MADETAQWREVQTVRITIRRQDAIDPPPAALAHLLGDAHEMTIATYLDQSTTTGDDRVALFKNLNDAIERYFAEEAENQASLTCFRALPRTKSGESPNKQVEIFISAVRNAGERRLGMQKVANAYWGKVRRECAPRKWERDLRRSGEAREKYLAELDRERAEARDRLIDIHRRSWRLPDGVIVFRDRDSGGLVYENKEAVPGHLARKAAPAAENGWQLPDGTPVIKYRHGPREPWRKLDGSEMPRAMWQRAHPVSQ